MSMLSNGWINGWRELSLRARLTLMVVVAITVVVGTTSAYFIMGQRGAMLSQMDIRSRLMRDDLDKKGLAIATTVALASERAIAVNDFLFLAQINETAKSNDSQIVYSAMINGEGIALVHSNPALAGQRVVNPNHLALNEDQASVHDAVYDGQAVAEVSVPLKVAGKTWGAVRMGLSLARLASTIETQRDEIGQLIRDGIKTSLLVSAVLIALGVALGTAAANALVRPLGKLMAGVTELQSDNFSSTVVVQGSPEFVNLARAFNTMTLAVRRRETALQAALAQADEANRLKSEFLANISHELRTPLNSIINVPAALLEDFPDYVLWKCLGCERTYEPDAENPPAADAHETCPECGGGMVLTQDTFFTGSPGEHKRFNERALTSGQHLLHVVNELLDFSRLQVGKMELFVDDVKPLQLVDDIRDTMLGLADAKKVRLTFSVPPNAATLHVDKVKMGQVFINLLGNAIKFTPERGEVNLSYESSYQGDATQAHFIVRDSGIGIPEDKLSLIFEPFRQVDGTHTRAYGGTGLGLAITDQIVRLHGGKVWAESQPGRGSQFHVVVPRERAQPKDQVQPAAADLGISPGAKPRRVVMVDDDGLYTELVKRMLTAVGMHVDVINKAPEAWDHISSSMPDLIIIDVMMPQVSGLEILKQLKSAEATQNIPVLVSTAYYANEHIVTQLGGLWLPKPWGAAELARCLVAHNVLPGAAITLNGRPVV